MSSSKWQISKTQVPFKAKPWAQNLGSRGGEKKKNQAISLQTPLNKKQQAGSLAGTQPAKDQTLKWRVLDRTHFWCPTDCLLLRHSPFLGCCGFCKNEDNAAAHYLGKTVLAWECKPAQFQGRPGPAGIHAARLRECNEILLAQRQVPTVKARKGHCSTVQDHHRSLNGFLGGLIKWNGLDLAVRCIPQCLLGDTLLLEPGWATSGPPGYFIQPAGPLKV